MPLPHKLYRVLTGVLVLLVVAGIYPTHTLAQVAGTAYLAPPETSQFPRLSAYLDVSDTEGNFISDLSSTSVTILEDGIELPLTGLQAERPGVQFVLAITPGAALAIRDAQGHSRYLHLLEGMFSGAWDEQDAGQDDFSLLTSTGAAVLHNDDPAELRLALEAYQLPAQGIPSLEVLAQALEVAADPLPRPGMERAVLFITPPQVANIEAGLQTLVARANQQNIHIFIWLAASADYFNLPGATQLAAACAQTGGRFFTFSGSEAVPDLEIYLEPMRPVYRLVYDSRAATAGPHQVSTQVNLQGGTLVSATQSFEINLQPPDLALVAPPVVIDRSFAPTATAGEPAATDLLPAEQMLTLAVTFPDGYERSLASTTLIVDGVVIAENTAPPFETFQWDLRGYVQDGLHTLRVEAVDNLGLVGQSPETVVQVTVPVPEQAVIVAFERQRLLVVGLGVLIAGSVLALVLIIGGRIRPQVGGRLASQRKAAGARRSSDKDPVTQPVTIPPTETITAQPRSMFSAWRERVPRRAQPATTTQAAAFLTPLAEASAAVLPEPIPLGAEPLTLGRDPLQASLVINDLAVDGLHARLIPQPEGYRLVDAGSTAGTWVNYDQVPSEGVILVHGDLVHLGHSGFRYTQREGGRRRKLTVRPLEPPV